jgi:hypothetical protein
MLTIGGERIDNTPADKVRSLVNLAMDGLNGMFDRKAGLFCDRVRPEGSTISKQGISQRYSVMCLLGLHRAELIGLKSPIDAAAVFTRLKADQTWRNNIGDLGLFIWLLAMTSPSELRGLLAALDFDKIFNSYPDARERPTMELAWFLSGLAHAQLMGPFEHDQKSLQQAASRTYNLLAANQGDYGLFAHSAGLTMFGRLRSYIGSFADQVYPIYALSKYGQAFGVPEAVAKATDCAHAICRLQGPLGQWWWHYNSRNGKTLGKFPVYAVHQDAMAPMALFAMTEASGEDFSQAIYKGLDWIFGANELQIDLRDLTNNLVWRSLYLGPVKNTLNELLGQIGISGSSNGLRILYEDRPYHLGWLLYAFAPILGVASSGISPERQSDRQAYVI